MTQGWAQHRHTHTHVHAVDGEQTWDKSQFTWACEISQLRFSIKGDQHDTLDRAVMWWHHISDIDDVYSSVILQQQASCGRENRL